MRREGESERGPEEDVDDPMRGSVSGDPVGFGLKNLMTTDHAGYPKEQDLWNKKVLARKNDC